MEAAVYVVIAPVVCTLHLMLSADNPPCVCKYSKRSFMFTEGTGSQGYIIMSLFARPFSHLIYSCYCCWARKSCYHCVYRTSQVCHQYCSYHPVCHDFHPSLCYQWDPYQMSVWLGQTAEDLLPGTLSVSCCLLASRTHYNLHINDSMSTVIECLSHFLAAAIQSERGETREIQKEEDKRVKE